MKIYKDRNLTDEVTTLDLGILPAGERFDYTFYVFNNSEATLRDMEFKVDHPEIMIMDYPEALAPQGIDKLVIRWIPSITLKEGLKVELKIIGKELYG